MEIYVPVDTQIHSIVKTSKPKPTNKNTAEVYSEV